MSPDPHERARESLEHLQAAGRELIAAARAALDVAEELVEDRETLGSMADAVAGFGDLVREAASRVFSHHSADTGTAATESPDIQRITVE